jgi:hypothetical protein
MPTPGGCAGQSSVAAGSIHCTSCHRSLTGPHVAGGWCAAAPGTTNRRTRGRPTATGTSLETGTTTRVSASPVRFRAGAGAARAVPGVRESVQAPSCGVRVRFAADPGAAPVLACGRRARCPRSRRHVSTRDSCRHWRDLFQWRSRSADGWLRGLGEAAGEEGWSVLRRIGVLGAAGRLKAVTPVARRPSGNLGWIACGNRRRTAGL